MTTTILGTTQSDGISGTSQQIKHAVTGATPAVISAINECYATLQTVPDSALVITGDDGNHITITGTWTSGQTGPVANGATYAVQGTAYAGSDPEILASIAGDGAIGPDSGPNFTYSHIAPEASTMTIKEDLVAEGICTEEDIANAEAAVACFDTLFGEDQGLDEALLCALLDSKVKEALMFCLTQNLEVCFNLDKSQLAEAIQNVDVNEDGEIAKITGTITVAAESTKG